MEVENIKRTSASVAFYFKTNCAQKVFLDAPIQRTYGPARRIMAPFNKKLSVHVLAGL